MKNIPIPTAFQRPAPAQPTKATKSSFAKTPKVYTQEPGSKRNKTVFAKGSWV